MVRSSGRSLGAGGVSRILDLERVIRNQKEGGVRFNIGIKTWLGLEETGKVERTNKQTILRANTQCPPDTLAGHWTETGGHIKSYFFWLFSGVRVYLHRVELQSVRQFQA